MPDEKAETGSQFLNSHSLFQFVQFLKEPKNSDNFTQTLVELKNNWSRLQEKVKKELPFWERKCKKEALSNLPIGDRDFPLEYFSNDHSVWLHIKLGQKRFVINLSTGEFYRFKLIAKKSSVAAYQRIEKMGRCIGKVRVSEFQLKAGVNYRVFTPYFAIPLDQAVKNGMITPENRQHYVKEWSLGLKALHYARILHGDISAALVLESSPNLEVRRAVIGGFKSPYFPEEATRAALQAEEFAHFEKCL